MTPMVKALLIANVAVYLAQWLLWVTARIDIAVWLGVSPVGVFSGAVWQPFTYMFVHSVQSPFHLLFNMLILWMLGGELERYWGGRAFLRYYLICGVGAGIAALILGWTVGPRIAITIGASGAIYGLILAYGLLFGNRIMLFMLLFPMKARTFAIVLFVIAFMSTFTPGGSTVSHVAHLGGMVVGFLYLKRAWRVGALWRDLRWRLARRRFRVVDRDRDRWIH
jgi:membrane associated rhomboid family serine protease